MILRRLGLAALSCTACFSEPGDATGSESSTSTSDDVSTSATSTATTSTSATSSADTSTSTSASTTSADTLTSSADTLATSDTGIECAADQVLAPIVPAGWSGPHVLFPGDADIGLPGCPETLDVSTPDAAFADGHASCGCTCAPRCSVAWTEAGGNDCRDGGLVAVGEGANLECIPFGQPGWIRNLGTPGSVECDSTNVTPHFDSLVWDTNFRVCETAAPCVSVPAPAIGPCIRSDGDKPCDDPLLPNKHLLAGSGTLGCDACGSCASGVVDACGNATVQVYQFSMCGGIVQQAIDAGSCSLEAEFSDAEMHVDTVVCNDSPATVTPVDVVTFCCA
ncbi:MAG TPA: hypothetical protein VG755_37335 [Nannocystaceae bacterium]|nr:hypothetical protein [Nannocystaceae bacterium]